MLTLCSRSSVWSRGIYDSCQISLVLHFETSKKYVGVLDSPWKCGSAPSLLTEKQTWTCQWCDPTLEVGVIVHVSNPPTSIDDIVVILTHCIGISQLASGFLTEGMFYCCFLFVF